MKTVIRPEVDDDRVAVFEVNSQAFPTTAEAMLVDALRVQGSIHVGFRCDGNEAFDAGEPSFLARLT